ncbi:MAG: hypothetical protein WAK37_00730, partial [Pseudolabrys sp.]
GQITSSGHGPNDRASSDGNVNAPIGRASSGATVHPTRFQGRPCNPGAAAQSAQPVRMQESVVIVGWVVIWRPIEIFLYDWIPLVRRCKLYRRLAASKVNAVSATRPS